MLGRKDYTREEFDHARTSIDEQVAAYHALVKAVGAKPGSKAAAALDAFETPFFNNMTLVLDRYFVHRVRLVTGKDGNPLNEVELLADALMNNDGVMRASTVIKLVPDESVTKIGIGERIKLDAARFERLADAFFAELERRFL